MGPALDHEDGAARASELFTRGNLGFVADSLYRRPCFRSVSLEPVYGHGTLGQCPLGRKVRRPRLAWDMHCTALHEPENVAVHMHSMQLSFQIFSPFHLKSSSIWHDDFTSFFIVMMILLGSRLAPLILFPLPEIK